MKGTSFLQKFVGKWVKTHVKDIKIFIYIIVATILLSGCREKIELQNISEISAQPDVKGIYVSWDVSKGANCYYVYRAAENDETYSYWGVTEKNEIIDITVLDGEKYTYRVYPALKTDKGYERGNKYLTTKSSFVLMTPSIISLQVSSKGCQIEWDQVESASNYTVYRGKEGESNFEIIGNTEKTHFIDITYDGSKAFTYAIEANSLIDGVTYSSNRSDAAQAYRTPVIKSALREDMNTSVIIWEEVGEGVEYIIYRALADDGEYELIGTTEQTFYRDMTANNLILTESSADKTSVNYYYKVQVCDTNSDAVSYSEKSQSVMLNSVESMSMLFVARYSDFANRNEVVDVKTDTIYVDEFEKDLIDLKNQGYVTITSDEVINYINNLSPLPEKSVMLTIDGAKHGVYEFAYPLLKKYNMKAVLSVMGGYIDNTEEISQDTEYCSWSQIAEMAESNCFELAAGPYYLNSSLGSNSDDREGVLKLGYESMEEYKQTLSSDVMLSNDKLRKLSGQNPVIFSYSEAARDSVSDAVLMQEFGFQLLLGDNNSRSTRMNYFIDNAPPQTQLRLINRRDRLSGTKLKDYIIAAQRFDSQAEEQ